MSGRIKYMDEQNIYVEISSKDVIYLKNHCNEHYDIEFQINNLPYKIQHMQFDLHSLLIANVKYGEFDHNTLDSTCDYLRDYSFRYVLRMEACYCLY